MSVLPSSVQVCGFTYLIIEVDSIDGGENIGEVDFDSLTIKIANTITPQTQLITLFHEITHIITEHSGYEVPEGLVIAFGYALYGVMRDNKKLNLYFPYIGMDT